MTDTTFTQSHRPYAGLVVNLRTALGDSFSRRREERRIRTELDQLTDRQLADIGLHRSQIGEVARGELSSAMLRTRA